MRQETTNTFDKGLNTDLNPIVTPNDVLTDCLNGTFITFNGDELTLQNDSGNTKIPIPEDHKGLGDDFVKISPGFYPLGVKEYGGVLYIASGKKGDGEEDMIEFGSYPSPENMSPDEEKGRTNFSIEDAEDLYTTVVLNEKVFKTGGYIRFQPKVAMPGDPSVGTNEQFELLWSPVNPGGLYKINLLHQLDNGTYNLTEDVWKDFKKHVGRKLQVGEHWVNSDTFKFYCPNRYKGKVAMLTELNEPRRFALNRSPDLEIIENGFIIKFALDMEGSEAIEINGYNVVLTLDDGTKVTTPLSDGSFFLSKEYNFVSYEITPDTNFEWDILPEEFKEKFTLKGSTLLNHLYSRLDLKSADKLDFEGIATERVLLLTDTDFKLDEHLEIIEEGDEESIPVVFALKGHDVDPLKYNVIGRYTIHDSKKTAVLDVKSDPYKEFVNLLDVAQTAILETFVDKSKDFVVRYKGESAVPVDPVDTYTVITFLHDVIVPVQFRWEGDSFDTPAQIIGTYNKRYRILYKDGKKLTVTYGKNIYILDAASTTAGGTYQIKNLPETTLSVLSWEATLQFFGSTNIQRKFNDLESRENLIHVRFDPNTQSESANLTVKFKLNGISDPTIGNSTKIKDYSQFRGWNTNISTLLGNPGEYSFQINVLLHPTNPTMMGVNGDLVIPVYLNGRTENLTFRIDTSLVPVPEQ